MCPPEVSGRVDPVLDLPGSYDLFWWAIPGGCRSNYSNIYNVIYRLHDELLLHRPIDFSRVVCCIVGISAGLTGMPWRGRAAPVRRGPMSCVDYIRPIVIKGYLINRSFPHLGSQI